MGIGMTILAVLKAWIRRGRVVLASSKGAFDLNSVLVAAAVVAILVGGTAVTTFGVIPWAQDNGAMQSLSAVNTAQSVAKVRDGKFMTGDGLTGASYLTTSGSSLVVGADTDGSCWVGFSRSDAGKTFFATADKSDPQPWVSGINTGCVDVTQQKQLARAVGTPMPIGYGINFGFNYSGELAKGNKNSTDNPPIEFGTTGVMAGKSVTHVSRGTGFACAIADNTPYCWGWNNRGQLGNGATTDSLVPVAVDTTALAGKEITALTSGSDHSCVIASGQAYCWGSDYKGQLGTSTTNTTALTPTPVGGALAGEQLSWIDAGYETTCAITGGTAYCWGAAGSGAVGTGNTGTNIDFPTAVRTDGVLAGKTVSRISSGTDITCAVADAIAYCWGKNTNGQIGNNSTANSPVPVAVDASGVLAGKSIISISAGDRHVCAIANAGVYCWGDSNYGQLGNGTTVQSLVPIAVSGPWGSTPVDLVSAGKGQSCASADGKAYCWGYNSYGQVGNGGTANALTPAAVSVRASVAGKRVVALIADYNNVSVVYE